MSKIFKKVKEDRSKFNKDVVNGLAMHQLEKSPDFLDLIIRSSIKSIDPEIPFKYHGFHYLTPNEDFENQFAMSSNNNIVDISKSTLYKVEFKFEYDGEEINRVISLIYPEKGAIITLSDALYGVVPVLTEYVISSSGNDVFVRLMKDKLMCKKLDRAILINGVKTPVGIIVSHIYKFSRNANDKVPIALMLFVKYGFDGVFKKYFNTKVLITMDQEPTEEQKKNYTVYESTGVRPRGLKDDDYQPHNIRILVKNKDVNPFMEVVIASLFNVFDVINKHCRFLIKEMNTDREKMFWKIMLGKIIFKNNYTVDKLLTSMDKYLSVINGYIDDITQLKLQENNIYIKDFYDLIALIIKDFNKIIEEGTSHSAKLKNRYIDINYYILFDHIAGINKTFYAINNDYALGRCNAGNIVKLFNKHFSNKMVFNLIKSGGLSLALTPVDYSGDNYYSKITSVLTDQNCGVGVKRSKNSVFPASTRTIHAEDIYMGDLLYLSKKAPTPRFRINPYVKINEETGKIIVEPEMQKILDKLDSLLSGKFIDEKFVNKFVIDTDDDADID